MPENAGTIYSDIRMRLTNLQRDITSANRKIDVFYDDSKKRASGFGSFWRNAFSTAFGFGTIQIIQKLIGAIKNMVGIFSGYQQSMKNVQSVTNATTSDMQIMSGAAKEAGETTRFTARQAADALYYLGSAGFSARQSVEALDGVLQLAGATQSDLATTSERVASVISQYNLAASDAGKVSNIFAAAITNSQATMEKLGNSFRQVGAVAAGFGLSLEQTTGILQELYNAGYQGQQAGRALKSALADLASPTTNMQKIFKKLNIDLASVNPELNDFADIIDVLAESGASTADIIDAFGKVAGPQMATLIKQGGDELRKYTAAVTDTNAAAEAYMIQNDSLAGSMDFLRSKLESTAIAIFEKLEPGVRDLIDSFINFLDTARPVGELLGNILNLFFKLASFSTQVITKIFDALVLNLGDTEKPMERFTNQLEMVNENIKDIKELEKTANSLNKLSEEYETLSSKTELTGAEQDRLRFVIQQIERIVPSAVTKFDEYGNAIELSGEKTKEAAKQMLQARKATIEYSKASLEILKPQLEDLIRIKGKELEQLSEGAKSTQEINALTRERKVLLNTLKLEFESLIDKMLETDDMNYSVFDEGQKVIGKYKKSIQDLGLTEFDILFKDGFGVANAIDIINESLENTDKLYTDLSEKSKERLDLTLEVQDAQKKLNELADFEKQLLLIDQQMGELENTTEDTGGKIDALTDISQRFWENYNTEIEKALAESKTFGDAQDVLKAKINFLKTAYLDLLNEGLDPAGSTLTRIRQEYDLTVIALDDLINKTEEYGISFFDLMENYYRAGIGSFRVEAEKMKEEYELTIGEILSLSAGLANEMASLMTTLGNNRLKKLEDQKKKELQNENLTAEEKIKIEEKYQKKKAELEYKAEMNTWWFKVAAVGASVAKAMAEALATLNPWVVGFTAAQGAVQVANVLASKPQPPSFDTGGPVFLSGVKDQGTPAILHDNEMVLNKDQITNLYNAIKQGDIGSGERITNLTVILQQDSIETARATARVMNDGIVQLKPERALRK
jgi:TP901 family phage tail tape measure protein